MELYEKSSSPAFYIMFPRYERGSLAKTLQLETRNYCVGLLGLPGYTFHQLHDYAFSAIVTLGGIVNWKQPN